MWTIFFLLDHVLFARQISGTMNTDLTRYAKIYSRMIRAFRSLGHLSAVYCVAFDRTGNFIITVSIHPTFN